MLRKIKVFVTNIFTHRVKDTSLKVSLLSFYRLSKRNFYQEVWLDSILNQLNLSSSDIVIDIGANVGQTLIKVASRFPSIRYFGFEPNPKCFDVLLGLIIDNNLTSFTVLPSALSDSSGFCQLEIRESDVFDSSASIIRGFRKSPTNSNSVWASMTTLDDCNHFFDSKIRLIKIDVEGAELRVLKGAINTLQKHNPLIIIEILPANSINSERHQNQLEICKILTSLKAEIYQVKNINRNISLERIQEFPIENTVENSNFIIAFPLNSGLLSKWIGN